MTERRAMTLVLSDAETAVLEALSAEKGLTKTALLRQALRLYQSVHRRIENGEKLFFEDPVRGDKAELMVL